MKCLYPQKSKKIKGKQYIIPCGYCINCRKIVKKNWTMRMVHESILNGKDYKKGNCFLTYTYNDENIPKENTLVKGHVKKLIKDLRNEGYKFRHFTSGEYGDGQGTRLEYNPHYHMCMFGYNVKVSCNDKYSYCQNVKSCRKNRKCDYRNVYRIWNKGNIYTGSFTSDSAAYVAGYVTKKIKKTEKSPKWVDNCYKNWRIQPEFSLKSNRPGLGKKYVDKILIPNKQKLVRFNGVIQTLPRYYREKLIEKYPYLKEEFKEKAEEIDLKNHKDKYWKDKKIYEEVKTIERNVAKKVIMKGGQI